MSTTEFTAAAERVVAFLRAQAPLLAWLVAELDDDGGWTPIAVVDGGYGVVAGMRMRWTDTFCSRMVQGVGHHVSVSVDDDPVFRDLPLAGAHPIGAYIGSPINSRGQLVATVCGLDPAPQPHLADHLRAVQMLADLLGLLHETNALKEAESRRAASAEAAARLDPLTGVLSRRGWLEQLRVEEGRADRNGCGLALLSLDVDGLKQLNDSQGHPAGDARLVAVARTLMAALRPADVLARLGGDEFAVAAVDVEQSGVNEIVERVQAALRHAGLPVAVGAAWRRPREPLDRAWGRADRRMYDGKQSRRG